jgi:hypothetical protein
MHRSKRSSFDHLVGAAEQGQWNRQAERLGGFEIEDQLGPASVYAALTKLIYETASLPPYLRLFAAAAAGTPLGEQAFAAMRFARDSAGDSAARISNRPFFC